jgi:hypothetical protein
MGENLKVTLCQSMSLLRGHIIGTTNMILMVSLEMGYMRF